MKQKLVYIVICLLLLTALPMTVLAEASLPLVVDNAALLTDKEIADLEGKALALREQYEMDVVILTENSISGQRPQDYADDYFDYNGYGYGESYSGVLLLLDMQERDWYISTSGEAIYALTDYSIQASMETPLVYLGEGMYYTGFLTWLDALPEYFEAYRSGAPIDGQADYSGYYYHGDQEEVVYYDEEVTPSLAFSLIPALFVGAVSIFVMRMQMNTKEPQHSASNYLCDDSFRLRRNQDLFLYSQVTKTARPKDPPPGSRGGGSSVHVSSSGRSHGGGGGKF